MTSSDGSSPSSTDISFKDLIMSMKGTSFSPSPPAPSKRQLPHSESVLLQLDSVSNKCYVSAMSVLSFYLQSYNMSECMHCLRTAAKSVSMVLKASPSHPNDSVILRKMDLQEALGDFARSFARFEQWRTLGHATGIDVISFLLEMEELEAASSALCREYDLSDAKLGKNVNLQDLSLLVDEPGELDQNADQATKNDATATGGSALLEYFESQPLRKRDRRMVLVACIICYERAAILKGMVANAEAKTQWAPGAPNDRPPLESRAGDANNELGTMCLRAIADFVPLNTPLSSIPPNISALFSSANFWFKRAMKNFAASKSLTNAALVRCNLSQVANLSSDFESAAFYLQEAHSVLEYRENQPQTWDMVSRLESSRSKSSIIFLSLAAQNDAAAYRHDMMW